jgi:type II secretory ATPase GspE/PulE/Tfp pilus assembly ATPase PilB-like protein
VEENDRTGAFDLVLRVLYADRDTIPTIPELGFLESQQRYIQRFIDAKAKLCCISGKVGSGKSTTLRSMYAQLPAYWKKYAAEDPVEYFHPNCTQMNLNGDNKLEKVVKSLKRGDLNALLMGEVRTADTMGLVRNVTFSGHPAFTTTHSETALGQLPYFLTPEMGMDNSQLSNPSFIGLLIHQVLVKSLCPHCAFAGDEARKILGNEFYKLIEDKYHIKAEKLQGVRARNPAGCKVCRKDVDRDGVATPTEIKSRWGHAKMKVLAEMFEPSMEDLKLIEANKLIDLTVSWRKSHAPFDEEDIKGKNVQEVGLYMVLQGWLDPRSVEEKTKPFRDAQVYWPDTASVHPIEKEAA